MQLQSQDSKSYTQILCPPPSLYHASHTPLPCLNVHSLIICYFLFFSLGLLWCYPIEISIFTTIIYLAISALLPFLAHIASNISEAEQGAPDIYRWSMPMFFLQADSPLQLYQLNPCWHLQTTQTQSSNEVPDFTLFSPLLHYMGVNHPNFNGDDIQPMSDTNIEPEVHIFTSPGRDRDVPEPPHITQIYHGKIDSELIS